MKLSDEESDFARRIEAAKKRLEANKEIFSVCPAVKLQPSKANENLKRLETFRQTDTVINWVVGIVASSIFVGIVFLIICGG
jgi:hypothetical protein